MKDRYYRIFTYLLVILVVFTIFWYLPSERISVKKPASSFGNFLSEYFYVISSEQNNSKILQQLIIFDPGKDQQLADFYNRLDWIPVLLPFNYQSNSKFTWLQIDGAGAMKPYYLQYWQTMRPVMQDTFSKQLNYVAVDKPVVHFRCSDVPFIKHAAHHIPTSESVEWIAQQVKARGFDKVYFLNCHAHLAEPYTSCEKYVDYYTQIFNDTGITVEKHCGTILDDFAMMFYSPLLVSLNASSYSFMAGVAKEPANYISCNMGLEMRNHYILQTDTDWLVDTRAPLLHSDVKNYNYTRDVIYKLKNRS